MSERRRFVDRDGDTWLEFVQGHLRLVTQVTCEDGADLGLEAHFEACSRVYGPLTEVGPNTEIRPDTDVRALLADVLEELANDVLEDYWSAADPTSERIYERFAHRIRGQALKLREGSS